MLSPVSLLSKSLNLAVVLGTPVIPSPRIAELSVSAHPVFYFAVAV